MNSALKNDKKYDNNKENWMFHPIKTSVLLSTLLLTSLPSIADISVPVTEVEGISEYRLDNG